MAVMALGTNRKYVCTKCGHRAQWRSFGLFVCCPECGSDAIACADIWDRFGPGSNEYRSKKEKGGGVDSEQVDR